MTLAKFDIYAAGEAVRSCTSRSRSVFTGTATTTLANEIQNVQIIDDAGGQVGTTINLPVHRRDSNVLEYATGTNSYVYQSSFGSASSPINYTIPANTTRVLSLKVDVQPNADFTAVQALLIAPTGSNKNLQGMISSQTSQTSGASGNTLTLSQSELTVTQDSSLGRRPWRRIPSVRRLARSPSRLRVRRRTVSNLSVGTNVAANNLANLKVMVNGVRIWPHAADGFTFRYERQHEHLQFLRHAVYGACRQHGSGWRLCRRVEQCDGRSRRGDEPRQPFGHRSDLVHRGFLVGSAVQGQNLSIASSGSSVTASINSSYQPAAGQLSMGTTGNVLASFNFNGTANVEDIKLTSLDIVDVATTTPSSTPSFSNLTLWNGAQEVGSVQSYTATTTVGVSSTPAFLYQFTSLLNNAVGTAYVPRNSVLTLTLKGDVNNFTTGNAVDLSYHAFEIATTSYPGAVTTSSIVVAQGATSGHAVTMTIPVAAVGPYAGGGGLIAGATQQEVLRNALVFSVTPVGATVSRSKTTNDELADITFNAGNGGSLLLGNATITSRVRQPPPRPS